jgi:GTP pyrophosphokinase
MPAKWVNAERFTSRVKIEIRGIDRMGMINDISSVISNNMAIDMRSFSLESNDGIFIGNITLEVKNKDQLEETLKQLKSIQGIDQIKRL